jgi:hypothetical protein
VHSLLKFHSDIFFLFHIGKRTNDKYLNGLQKDQTVSASKVQKEGAQRKDHQKIKHLELVKIKRSEFHSRFVIDLLIV